jgi:hypothetical protein
MAVGAIQKMALPKAESSKKGMINGGSLITFGCFDAAMHST